MCNSDINWECTFTALYYLCEQNNHMWSVRYEFHFKFPEEPTVALPHVIMLLPGAHGITSSHQPIRKKTEERLKKESDEAVKQVYLLQFMR
jgi:hypothetical protein